MRNPQTIKITRSKQFNTYRQQDTLCPTSKTHSGTETLHHNITCLFSSTCGSCHLRHCCRPAPRDFQNAIYPRVGHACVWWLLLVIATHTKTARQNPQRPQTWATHSIGNQTPLPNAYDSAILPFFLSKYNKQLSIGAIHKTKA